jgi:L-threonylcarbamoyladenylate synthase
MQATDFPTVAATIARGGVALVPTDTNYALACDPWNEQACARLFEIKRRPADKPLTLFVARPEEAFAYARLPAQDEPRFRQLSHAHWPGPLNMIVPASASAPRHRYFDPDTVSIVCNANEVLQGVLRACGHPLALTSANISGTQVEGLISPGLAESLFGHLVDVIAPPQVAAPRTTCSSTIVRLGPGRVDVVRQGDVVIA